MLRLSIFVLVSVGIDLLHGQECSLQLVPQVPIIQVARGNNVTILCNASCYGRHTTNRFSWYDRHNQPIGTSGRVFSVQYNRGMFARLILLNTDFSETGRYTCAGRVGVDVVQKYIDISVTEKDFEVVEYVDDGPRRGDVRVDEPFLPRRRPARDVRNRRAADDADITTMPTTDSNAAITTQEGGGSGSMPDVTTDTTGMAEDPAGGEPSMVGLTTATGQSSNEITTASISSGNIQDQSTDVHTPTGTEQSPSGSSSSSPSSSSSETPKGQPTNGVTLQPTAGKSQSSKTTLMSTSTNKPSTKSSVINGTGYKGIYKTEKTAFGKYGVLAFALALSAAILLLYTLILLNVIIPRCCTNRQSVSFREALDSKHKQNGPSAVDAVAMKPLEIEPRPNSPDDAFTTVDLDDEADPKPKSTTPGDKEADTPVSPSSDPGSPSKFVSTFLIGRKPSESSPVGVYLHEGKAGDTEQVISETGDSQGTSDPKPEQNTAGETKKEEEKKELGGQSAKGDVDTSTEVDTSTDTKDTSASSSDLGDLPTAELKT